LGNGSQNREVQVHFSLKLRVIVEVANGFNLLTLTQALPEGIGNDLSMVTSAQD
jgi:hypothetical protein